MINVLVTGADRFIGGRFASLYKHKYNICAPVNVDFTDYAQVEKLFGENSFNAVVHAYGKRSVFNREQLSADALIAYKNVQRLCVLNSVNKLLVIGDASDLDGGSGTVNADEEDLGKNIPQKGYGVSRYLISSLALKDRISTVLRFFDVYGGGASVAYGTPMGVLSRAVMGKKQIELNADRTFSAIYIEDACKIIAAFIDKTYEKGIYNVCSPTPVTLYDFAKKARSYAKKDGRELTLVLGGETNCELTGDCGKLLSALGGFKFTAFGTGVTKTLDYCKAHKSCLRDPNDD